MKKFTSLPLTLYRLHKKIAAKELPARFGQVFQSNEQCINTINNEFGYAMRPLGVNLADICGSFRGKHIYELPQGLVLPKELLVVNRHTDCYSLEAAIPMTKRQFLRLSDEFFSKQKLLTKTELKQKIMNYFTRREWTA